jgi:protein-tyrosine kinase
MDRLQRVVELYKKSRQGRPAPPRNRAAGPPPPIVYTHTRSIELDDELLREQRVMATVDPGPFVDSYKILRTQVMHRLREHHWSVLAVTSPGRGEGKTPHGHQFGGESRDGGRADRALGRRRSGPSRYP